VVPDTSKVARRGLAVPVLVLDRRTRRLEAAPRVVTRGVFAGAAAGDQHQRAGRALEEAWESGSEAERQDAALTRERLRRELRRFFRRERQRPLIEPVVVEV
jgi:mRNA degradation ribonuclease J1/J2